MTSSAEVDHQEMARTFLRLHGRTSEHLEYYVSMARRHGLTDEEIEESLDGG